MRPQILPALLAAALCLTRALGDERHFAYTYEPETMIKGGFEVEQWATFRGQRSKKAGQDDFRQWEFRQEAEYGVTDRYSLALYANSELTSFRDPSARRISEFKFTGVSIENRYMFVNPADHAVGLTLYFEPRFSGDELELEQRIILGQRWGDWKWALNLTHAAEWEEHFHEVHGEVEASFGLTRDLGKHWSLGLEFRNHSEVAAYREWEYSALFLGPAVNYRREKWWATLAVLPQIYGANFGADVDGNRHLVLDDQERINIRLLVGLSF